MSTQVIFLDRPGGDIGELIESQEAENTTN
jgi:hypothetical protein